MKIRTGGLFLKVQVKTYLNKCKNTEDSILICDGEDVGIAQWLGAHDCNPNDQRSIHVGGEFLEFS